MEKSDLFKALTGFKRLLKKVGVLGMVPSIRVVWISYWPTWFTLIIAGLVTGDDSVLSIVFALVLPFSLGSLISKARMGYLKRYLRQTCVHTKTNFKLRRKYFEQYFFMFASSIMYLSGINSCLALLLIEQGDNDDEEVILDFNK